MVPLVALRCKNGQLPVIDSKQSYVKKKKQYIKRARQKTKESLSKGDSRTGLIAFHIQLPKMY